MGITKLGGGPSDSFAQYHAKPTSPRPPAATQPDFASNPVACSMWSLLVYSMANAAPKPTEPAATTQKRHMRGVTWV